MQRDECRAMIPGMHKLALIFMLVLAACSSPFELTPQRVLGVEPSEASFGDAPAEGAPLPEGGPDAGPKPTIDAAAELADESPAEPPDAGPEAQPPDAGSEEPLQCPDSGGKMIRTPGGCIDAYEVTRAAYGVFVAARPDQAADPVCMAGPSVCQTGCDKHPQVCVTEPQAAAYCTWVGKRLCRGTIDNAVQGEWAYACTGGNYPMQQWPYAPSGPGWDACATAQSITSPVGAHPVCEGGFAGLFDMSGNAAEWVDACNVQQCAARGGAFDALSYGWASCMQSEIHDRQTASPRVGFRCCAD